MRGALLVLAGAAAAAAVLASIGDVPPWLMLATVVAVGAGLSIITIAWQSIMPHIVGRPLAGTAAILDGASYNGARAIGPIIGGALLTATASEALFLALGVVFASRRRVGSAMPRSSERMLPALAASTRFVRNSAWTRRLLYRLSVFGVPSSCLWALLPVIAHKRLGLSSSQFGLMFGLVGLGAVVGTVAVMPLRSRMTQNAFICAGSLAYAAVLAAIATVSNVVVVTVLMVVVGASWVGVQSSWMMAAHGALPTWIRARVIALMLLVFQWCQAFGSPIWGTLADILSLEVAFATASVVMMCAGIGALIHGIVPAETITPTLDAAGTRTAVPLSPVAEESEPVRVTVIYQLRPGGHASFRALRRDLARARRRLDARRWTAEVGTDRVIEQFDFRDVAEYRRYLSARLTIRRGTCSTESGSTRAPNAPYRDFPTADRFRPAHSTRLIPPRAVFAPTRPVQSSFTRRRAIRNPGYLVDALSRERRWPSRMDELRLAGVRTLDGGVKTIGVESRTGTTRRHPGESCRLRRHEPATGADSAGGGPTPASSSRAPRARPTDPRRRPGTAVR